MSRATRTAVDELFDERDAWRDVAVALAAELAEIGVDPDSFAVAAYDHARNGRWVEAIDDALWAIKEQTDVSVPAADNLRSRFCSCADPVHDPRCPQRIAADLLDAIDALPYNNQATRYADGWNHCRAAVKALLHPESEPT